MKTKLFIIVVLTLVLTLCLVGCGKVTEQDANGCYVNVEIESSVATVEVVVAKDGAFVLDTFTTSAEGLTAAKVKENVISAYSGENDDLTKENYVSKKGTYTYDDNAFIVRRMALVYEDGGKEFCYIGSDASSFELSPTIPVVLLYCLIGFLVTLFVLCFLMLIIKLLNLISDKINALGKKKEEVKEAPVESAPVLAKGSAGDLKLVGVSDKDAAMIMAILADELQVPLNTLRFISITDITDSEVEK